MSEYNILSSLEEVQAPMLTRSQPVRIEDSNSQNYSGGEIKFSTASLASSDKLYAVNEGVLMIPKEIKIIHTADMDTAKANFLLAMKHGTYSSINAIKVRMDNKALCNYTDLTNIYCHFNVLSSYNSTDAINQELMGFYKDENASYSYKTVTDADGVGECNSQIGAPTNMDVTGLNWALKKNLGFMKRAKLINYSEDEATTKKSFSVAGYAGNNFKSNKTSGGVREITYNVMLYIKLADLHDCFKTMPVVRNPNIQFEMQYHACKSILGTGAGTWTVASSTVPNHNFCDYQVSSQNGNAVTVAGTMTITEKIGNVQSAICQLVIPRLEMTPEAESDYISSMGSEKLVDYTHIEVNQSLQTGSSINWAVNQSLANMTGFVMLIRLGANTNPLTSSNAPTNYTTDASPFTSAPNMLCSAQLVQNLQVYVSNVPVFDQPINYNWDMYVDLIRQKSVNGNGTSSLMNSGFISRADWEDGIYGYIYCKLPESQQRNVDQSLKITFNNAKHSAIPCLSLLAFVETRKQYTVDVNSGKIAIIV